MKSPKINPGHGARGLVEPLTLGQHFQARSGTASVNQKYNPSTPARRFRCNTSSYVSMQRPQISLLFDFRKRWSDFSVIGPKWWAARVIEAFSHFWAVLGSSRLHVHRACPIIVLSYISGLLLSVPVCWPELFFHRCMFASLLTTCGCESTVYICSVLPIPFVAFIFVVFKRWCYNGGKINNRHFCCWFWPWIFIS